MIYRPNSPHERLALNYIRDFKMRTGKDLATLDPDTREGVEVCRLYEIMDFPAILARDSDGKMLNLWIGEPLPRFDEVSYYSDDTFRQ